MSARRSTLVKSIVGLAVVVVPLMATAVVTPNGRSIDAPVALDLSGVGFLSNGCSSVLLSGGWVLGAAHCALGPGGTVTFANGSVATIVETLVSPSFSAVGVHDMSLMRIDVVPAGVIGYTIGSAGADGRTVVLAGYGAGGTGADGATLPGGVLRTGYNQYENLLEDDPDGTSYGGHMVGYDFDDGTRAHHHFGSAGLGRSEASIAGGDSGGPSFSLIDGIWQVVGIHIAVADDYGFGFGAIGYDLLLGEELPWLQGVIALPKTSSRAAPPPPRAGRIRPTVSSTNAEATRPPAHPS